MFDLKNFLSKIIKRFYEEESFYILRKLFVFVLRERERGKKEGL